MGKFSNCFCSSLDAVDLYPITPGYKLGGKRRFTSFLTLLSSIGILIFVLVLFCIEIADLARHKNAQILVSEFTNNGDNITVFSNDSTFQMAFGLMTTIRGNTFRYDPMQIVVASVRDGNDTYLNRTIIQVELCQPYHFKNVNYSEYEGLYCFRFQDENELFVSDLDHRALQIRFYHCNVTAYQCPNNMDFLVKNTVFKGVYTSWSVNPMIYDAPLVPGYEVMTSGILMSIHREFFINVNTIEFITDNGWLWSSQTTQTVTNIQVIQQDMETVTQDESGYTLSPDQGAAFLTIQIARGGNKVIYQRSYKKIQDVFAEVTGLAQILIPIIGLCLLPYMPFAKLKMYEKTANELYYFNRGRKSDSTEPNGEPEDPNEEVIAAGEGLGDEGNPGGNEEGRQGKISSVLSLESIIKGIPEMNENSGENKDQEGKPNEDVVVAAERQGDEGNALNKEEEGSQEESDSRLSLENVIKDFQEENKSKSENEWISVEIIDVPRDKPISYGKLNKDVIVEAENQDNEGNSLNKEEEERQEKSSSVLSLDSVIRKVQTSNKDEGVSVDIIDVAKDKPASEHRYDEPNEEIIITAKRQDKEEEGRQGKIGSVSSLENLIHSVQEMNINMIDRSKDKPGPDHRYDQTNLSENKEDIKPVKVSFWVWLKNLFKPQPEVKILAKTINQIEAHMDFVTLMKHLVEIDKFKKCVLNDDQLTIFNSIQKPVRSVDEDGNRDDISHEEEEKDDERVGTSSRRSRSVKEAYENLKKKEVLTEFDKRLLEYYRKKFE